MPFYEDDGEPSLDARRMAKKREEDAWAARMEAEDDDASRDDDASSPRSPRSPRRHGFTAPRSRDDDDDARDAARPKYANQTTELDCPCCFNLFMEPLTLACGHSFCRACLVAVAALAPDGARCPVCRARRDVRCPATHAVNVRLQKAVLEKVGDCDDYEVRRAADARQIEDLAKRTPLPSRRHAFRIAATADGPLTTGDYSAYIARHLADHFEPR
ncbi:hypothetical protein M885DRAFT_611718 [Pelagophyceae sp. CCMP2097]|nr:hypothetical protein M885DRAFT_611718 [Pelagophyceae sp. CCMP2097]